MISAERQSDFTTLNTTIVGQPWQERDGFILGVGVDAITGQLRKSAVKSFEPVPSKGLRVEVDHMFIQSQSDLKELIDASLEGSYNIEGVEVSGALSFLNDISVSDLAVTIVQWRKIEQSEFALAPQYELAVTPGPDFRNQHGDYFVAGYRGGAELFVTYQCRFSSAESRLKFSAEMAADIPDVFSAEGSVAFERIAKKNNASVRIKYYANVSKNAPSNPPGGWTPQNIVEVVVRWFNENSEIKKLESYLQHYSLIDPKLSPNIPISPDVFAELGLLRDRFFEVRALFGACPDFGMSAIRERFGKLSRDMEAFQSVMPYESQTRQRLLKDAADLQTELACIANRQRFYAAAIATGKLEPAKDVNIDADQGVTRWSYGLTAGNLPGVSVDKREDEFKADWDFGWRTKNITFRDSTKIIVGWDVICNWNSYGGDWSKACSQIIGRSDGSILVKSDYDRGCNWTVTWYFVEAALYPPAPWQDSGIHSRGPIFMSPSAADGDEAEWTVERMAAARPLKLPILAPESLNAQWEDRARIEAEMLGRRTDAYPLAPEFAITTVVPNPSHYPQRTVGKIYFQRDGVDHVASGVVINRRGILSAAHVFYYGQSYSTNIIFVPATDNGIEPYGRWQIDRVMLSDRWPASQQPALDVAFCTVKPLSNQYIGDVVGWVALEVNTTPEPGAMWNDVGYPAQQTPAHPQFDGQVMWQSQGEYLGHANGILTKDDELSAGSSGGPWFSCGKKDVVSGVQSACNANFTLSVSPYFGQWVRDMYNMIFR